MSFPKLTLYALASLAVISTLVAKLQSIVNINEMETQFERNSDDIIPDSRLHHVMWFMQVSDLHLSMFQDNSRSSDLKKFCSGVVPVVKPSLVLATGDLVDSRTRGYFGSKQFVEEWITYQQILNETNVTLTTTWLDIRGNHDNFNVLSLDDEDDNFRRYSVQGRKHRRSYSFTLQHGPDVYNFIGIDACMNPGPKRPFNFLGVLEKDEYVHIQNLLKEAKGNLTIWFGHYPTSTIVAPYPGARELMRSSGPYLCGHLHTFGGVVPEMYTIQATGSLELELADWKENRKYRLCAVDHGMFSFIDQYLSDWPLILVTNPKNALFTMPTIEPLHRMVRSSHIRVLVFSPFPIKYVKLKIDDGEWQTMKVAELPLFVLRWNPNQYLEGLHKITIHAKDLNGNEKTLHHGFSLDGTRPVFPIMGRLALMGHLSVGQAIFGFMLLMTIMPLCVLRVTLCFGKGEIIKAKSEQNIFYRWIFKLSLVASSNKIFWPVIIVPLYIAVGPWFVGRIIDEKIGVCFVWGIFLAGAFLPGGLTFVVASVYLFTFYIPFIFCLSHCLYRHYYCVTAGETGTCSIFWNICRNVVMLIFIFWQCLFTVVCYGSYGVLSIVLGFAHSWSIILALFLWRMAVTLPDSEVRSLCQNRPILGTPLLQNNDCPDMHLHITSDRNLNSN